MALSLAELTTPLTRAEVETAIYTALASKGVSTTSWKPGAVVRTLIFGVALVLSAASSLQAKIAESGFLALATQDWLTAVALYVYGVTRDTGAFATGTVTLTNNGGGVYAGGIGDLVVQNPSTKKTYRNTAAYTLAAGPATEAVVPVQADEIGTASTSTPDTITAFVTTLLGVAVTNPTALVGRDPESDPALRTRCLAKTGTLSPNGPKDAYTYVALSAKKADGVTSVGVTRVRVIADGDGNVTVYVASASGAITGTSGDPETDLGAVHDAIQTQAVPLAVTETTVAATNKLILITYEIWLRDTLGQTEALVEEAIEDALDDFVSTYPIGGFVIPPASGKVYLSAIETVIGSVFPEHTVKLEVTIPAGDTDLLINEVPVPSTITCLAVNFVSGGVI
jgi:phage-related baseplate assembly protein